MPQEPINLDFIMIYAIYGLAFFSLGLSAFLESGRSPSFAEKSALRPLAIFGFAHGIHEWLEMLILLGALSIPTNDQFWAYIRLGILAFSFLSLIAYGIQVLYPPRRLLSQDVLVGGMMVLLYLFSLLAIGGFPSLGFEGWSVLADLMARYILAVPGALLATLALRSQAKQAHSQKRPELGKNLAGASTALALYGVTQLFGPPAKLLLAQYVNTEVFSLWTGFPIQLIRGILGIVITYYIILATQVVEKERQRELLTAQQDRVKALEQLQIETARRNTMRRDLLRKTVIHQEEERSKISRELHDETAQLLTAYSANLAALKNQLPNKGKKNELISRLQDLTNRMSLSIHRLVRDLRPPQLDELGLSSALEFLVDNIRNDVGLRVSLDLDQESNQLDSTASAVLFRVAQEALTNIAKHAQTKAAQISLVKEGETVKLVVSDEGVGFNFADNGATGGLGILGMRERIESIGGDFNIESSPDTGTQVFAIVPIPEPSAKAGDS